MGSRYGIGRTTRGPAKALWVALLLVVITAAATSVAAQDAPDAAQQSPASPSRNVVRRDPFAALISKNRGNNGSVPERLPPGKAGLQVSTLSVDGAARGPNGMIAVVSNPQ